tara:strand:- start:405 stop:1034 length:630 start_codon:yes stop_codon:yes gene_type:complete
LLPTFEYLADIKVDMPLCDQWLGHLIGRLVCGTQDLKQENNGPTESKTCHPNDLICLFDLLCKNSETYGVPDLCAGLLLGILSASTEKMVGTEGKKLLLSFITGNTTTSWDCLQNIISREIIKSNTEWRSGKKVVEMLQQMNSEGKEDAMICPTLMCVQHVRTMLRANPTNVDAVMTWISANRPSKDGDGEFGREIGKYNYKANGACIA